MYPTNAIHVIRFMYHPKVIFSSPMTTTPAALPTMSIEPPTPAQYASSCQKMPSMAMSPAGVIGYMPMLPATSAHCPLSRTALL